MFPLSYQFAHETAEKLSAENRDTIYDVFSLNGSYYVMGPDQIPPRESICEAYYVNGFLKWTKQ
ncbi:hypothetical protein UFOVP273_122 [uncultured Caudovirales phage]|uniref:Uncharacterized protein n=1 Tax=uncultured Caudovirales phage TaxID=2100421 RepID=A0A6J5LMC8_9CAUD|nr:hypothetical protein UFOVP273_122 [uncultured Caudovirales phage]